MNCLYRRGDELKNTFSRVKDTWTIHGDSMVMICFFHPDSDTHGPTVYLHTFRISKLYDILFMLING